MKIYFVVLLLFILGFNLVWAEDPTNSGGNGATGSTPSTGNTGNAQLLDKINKETQKGLKVFKNVVKSQNSSKTDFFANVGKNPTAAEFEGKSGTDTILDKTFKFKDQNQQQ